MSESSSLGAWRGRRVAGTAAGKVRLLGGLGKDESGSKRADAGRRARGAP